MKYVVIGIEEYGDREQIFGPATRELCEAYVQGVEYVNDSTFNTVLEECQREAEKRDSPGSLRHIVGEDGHFKMDTIENMGDAYEALHECFEIIRLMTGGNKEVVNRYCRLREFPEIRSDMKISKIAGDPWEKE